MWQLLSSTGEGLWPYRNFRGQQVCRTWSLAKILLFQITLSLLISSSLDCLAEWTAPVLTKLMLKRNRHHRLSALSLLLYLTNFFSIKISCDKLSWANSTSCWRNITTGAVSIILICLKFLWCRVSREVKLKLPIETRRKWRLGVPPNTVQVDPGDNDFFPSKVLQPKLLQCDFLAATIKIPRRVFEQYLESHI